MRTTFRWHVSRILIPDTNDTENRRIIHFKITPQAANILTGRLKEEADLMNEDSDNMEWWQTEEEQEIEGWAYETTVIETLTDKNILKATKNSSKVSQKRQLEENMVLLQFVRKKVDLNKALKKFRASKEGIPNLDPLLKIEDAGWLDFTQQARSMANSIYRKALNESEVSSNES